MAIAGRHVRVMVDLGNGQLYDISTVCSSVTIESRAAGPPEIQMTFIGTDAGMWGVTEDMSTFDTVSSEALSRFLESEPEGVRRIRWRREE